MVQHLQQVSYSHCLRYVSREPLHVHSDEDGGGLQFLVATHTNQLLVFRDTHLMWAAHVEYSPTALCVAHLQ